MVTTLVPNLALIGFMGCGKSTIGRRCARSLGFRFRDSDAWVERRVGCSIPEYFAREGEPAFRRVESEAIATLSSLVCTVLATGGGAVLDPANVKALRAAGVLVWLRVDPRELVQRCGDPSSRPLLSSADDPQKAVETILRDRVPAYEAAADATVDTTGLRREDATARVLAAYRSLAQTWPHVPCREAAA